MEIAEFCLDESGRFFVVVAGEVEDELARYGDLWGKATERDVTLRGRKVLSYEACNAESPFHTFTAAGKCHAHRCRTLIAARGYM